jgi:hypothetical protein
MLNNEIRGLVREVRFALIRFEEEADIAHLDDALEMFTHLHQMCDEIAPAEPEPLPVAPTGARPN